MVACWILLTLVVCFVAFLIYLGIINKKENKNDKIFNELKEINKNQTQFYSDFNNFKTEILDKYYHHDNRIKKQDEVIAEIKANIKKCSAINVIKSINCLIIDDDPDVLAFTKTFLKMLPEKENWKYKFNIKCAKSCEEGIQLLSVKKYNFNVAIVDYKLPTKSGFYFWHYCKENKKLMNKDGDMNIIIYSACPEQALQNIPRDIAPHFLECNNSEVIEKDEKWENLKNKLEYILEKG